ncbi:MAG TPA: hypothetical protein ENK18_03675 [Deltaproteobacteria bacterium]|nr:hypothetical protein [Deltaproteobacteria bacterium]
MLSVPVPLSEVVDRLTILQIKRQRISDPQKRARAESWALALEEAWDHAGLPELPELPEHAALSEVNAALWEIEDRLRAREARRDFGPGFVQDARSVYQLNDRRARLKAELDARLGSGLVDVKTHPS